jgi:serine phosphatase RsbU (regulator of sigma subunit)
MWDKIVAVIYSLILHAILIGILLSGSDLTAYFSTTPPQNAKNGIDETQVQLELERLTRAETIKNAEQQAQQYALEQKKLEYQQLMKQAQARVQALQQEQKIEQQQLEQLEQRRRAEQALLEQAQPE